MSVLIKYEQNPTTLKDEVVSYSFLPKTKLPSIIPDKHIAVDSVPKEFIKEWFKFYVVDGNLLYNPARVSLEAAKGE